ncbi:hypothetical protein L6452_11622 [Arctium lappa]|uniref:Uncharacterized protein n=1 Tax=Arctium lappa TaxID=4217 RepID=A0ACB9DPM4_ARCLA|nr:hypothetical protein L6452_11622 [Arctium lappa]
MITRNLVKINATYEFKFVSTLRLYVSHAPVLSYDSAIEMFQTANFPNRGVIPTFKMMIETLEVQLT